MKGKKIMLSHNSLCQLCTAVVSAWQTHVNVYSNISKQENFLKIQHIAFPVKNIIIITKYINECHFAKSPPSVEHTEKKILVSILLHILP